MSKVEAKVLADLCEMAAEVIDTDPAVASLVARRLAKSIRGLSEVPSAL